MVGLMVFLIGLINLAPVVGVVSGKRPGGMWLLAFG